MEFAGTHATGARLSDYEGKIVALGFLEETEVPTPFGLNEAVRARFFVIDDGLAKDLGETLVFQQVLRSTIRDGDGVALVGTLTRKTHQSNVGEDGEAHTYLVIDPLTTEGNVSAIRAFAAL